jgi:hypothetical protein
MRPVRMYCVPVVLGALLGGGSDAQEVTKNNKGQVEHVEVYDDADAYKVYAATLPIDSWYWEGSSTMLIVREIPPREFAIGGPREALRGDPAAGAELEPVFAAFEQANKQPRLLNSDVDLHRAHRFIRSAELNAAFKDNGWQGFRREFPDAAGYLILSAVGFNPEKTMALLYVEHRCGDGCGAAHYYVLQKRDGVWVRYFPPSETATSKQ